MSDEIICKEIRQVSGGFIAELRWPVGNTPSGYGEVICKTFEELIKLLKEAAFLDDD